MSKGFRINGFEQMKSFYSIVFEQKYDFKPHHISLYLFLLNQNNRNNWADWFKCAFDLAMAGSCIGSKKTYYQCLFDLKEWGLIDYVKGSNEWKAARIKIVVLKCTSTIPQCEPQDVPQCEPQGGKSIYNLKPITYNNLSDSKEPDLKTNKVVKKKREKEPHKSYNYIKEKFLTYYSEAGPGTPYYFEAKDGNKINRIITKLKTLVKTKKPTLTSDQEPHEINRAFDYVLANMNDKFVNENLTLSMIDSKFNEIIAKIKKAKEVVKESTSIEHTI